MATNINTILDWFRTGKKPTQAQFWASWQSFWHKEEKIPISTIENLQETLDDKANEVHTHTISDVTGLTQALNAKGGLTSPSFTGTPTAPTASPGTNTDQIATTAFVKASSSAVISQTISDNVTNSSPSQRAVHDALALKANVTGQNNFNGHQFINSGNLIVGSTENTVDALQVTGSAHFTGQVTIPDGTVPTSAVNKSQIDLKADLIDGKIPVSQLPSSSTSVFEFDSFEDFPASGISGKIYIAKDTNLMYRWSDSAYVTTGSSLSIGEIATTAYRGDRGKTAYDHSQATGNPHNTQLTDISGLSAALAGKQATLTSGTNIKSVNGTSLLGNGDVAIVQNSLTASTTLSPSVTAVNTALALKANDTNVVHTSNSETIGGIKTFTNEVIVPSGTAATSAVNKGQIDLKADLVAGKIPASQLPSYVDDVLEFANLAAFPATGESGKLYIAIDTNLIYRWSGSTYVVTSSSLALGETAATAYRGDRGKIAYDHSQATGNPHNTQVADISGLSATLSGKQATLVSGTNIKTVGGQSLVGSGNITEVQDNLTASTSVAPSVNAVNTALALKANDANVVHRTGNEAIAGVKTFSDPLVISGFTNIASTGASSRLAVYNNFASTARLYGAQIGSTRAGLAISLDNATVQASDMGLTVSKVTNADIGSGLISSLLRVLGSGNTIIGDGVDTGEKLQVNGTTKLAGNTTVIAGNKLTIDSNAGVIGFIITRGGNEGVEIFPTSAGNGTFVLQNYDRTGLAYKPLILAGSKIVTNQGNLIIDSTNLNPTDTGEKLQVNSGTIAIKEPPSGTFLTVKRSTFGVQFGVSSLENGYATYTISGTALHRVFGNGNTIIGSSIGTDSGYKLDVQGISRSKRIGANGGGLATSLIVASDAKTVSDAVGVFFQALNSSNTDVNYGLIAVNVEAIAAGAQSGSMVFRTVNNGAFVTALTLTKEGNLITNTITGTTGSFTGQLTIPDGTALTSAVNLDQLNTKANENQVVHLTGNESKTGNFNISGNVGIGTTSPTAKLEVNGTGSFTGIVKVPNGVNATDAVNKGQLDSLTSVVISANTTSLNLPTTNKETTIVFNGSSAAGWQVPVGGQYLGFKYTIINKTSAIDVTLNLASGTFWLQGATPAGMKVSPRQTVTIINDGTHWSVLNVF